MMPDAQAQIKPGPALLVEQARAAAQEKQNRGSVQLLTARFCFMAAGYLVSVILARELGPAQYGVYGVVLSFLIWVEMSSAAGIPAATAKLLPEHEDQPEIVESSARFILIVISVILFGICWLAAPWLAQVFHLPDGAWLFRLAAVDIPLNGLYLAYQGILYGRRWFGSIALSVVIYGFGKLAAILFLLTIGFSVSGALVANAAATVIVLCFLLFRFPPRAFWPTLRLVKPMLVMALPIGVYLLAVQALLSADLWALQALWTGDPNVIGMYVASLTLAKALTVIPSVLTGIVFSSISWALAHGDDEGARLHIRDCARFALVVLIPGAALIALNGREILSLLFSEEYAPGAPFLAFQLIGFALFAFLDLFAHSIMAASKQVLAAGVMLALIPIVFLFNFLLIPIWGGVGAALSLALAVALGTAVTAGLSMRRYGRVAPVLTLARALVATGLAGLVSVLVPVSRVMVIPKLALLFTIYALVLYLSGEFTFKEIRFLTRLKGRSEH